MRNSKSISTEEYQMLRNELEDNIKKQDDLHNVIYTVLGLSLVFNNWLENSLFLIAVMLISSVLLSRIIHCRNTVYYLSAYLSSSESLACSIWEKRINSFKDRISRKKHFTLRKYIFINIIFKCAFVMKNMGNLILCGFVFFQLLNLLSESEQGLIIKVTLLIMGGCSLLLNLVFTAVICFDKKVKQQYIEIWNAVIQEDKPHKYICRKKKLVSSYK